MPEFAALSGLLAGSRLLEGQLVESLGWTLLHFLWQGALIAALYALGRLVLHRAAPRLRLWLGHVALLALAIAPVLTFVRHLGQAGIGGAGTAAHANGLQASIAAAGNDLAAAAGDAVAATGQGLVASALPWLVAAWLVGVVVLSVRALRQWRALRRLCTVALPADPAWQRRLAVLAARMGIHRPVQLRECALVLAPMLVGWLKPVILLPASLCTRLPPEQVELLLVHELAHVRRLDYLANLVQMALETILFYHPAVHWISRCVREDRELCCDDMVTGNGADRLSYARALLTLAEQHVERQTAPALAATGGALLARIERIVDAPRSDSPVAATTPLLVLAGAVLLATLGMRAFAPDGNAPGASTPATHAPLPMLPRAAADLALPVLKLAVADLAAGSTRPAPLQVQLAPEAQPLAPEPSLAAAAPEQVEVPAPGTPMQIDIPAPTLGVPDLLVQSPDATLAEATRSVPVTAATDAASVQPAFADGLAPLSVRAPDYPRRARVAGIEGHVTLSYSIRGDGRVTDVRIEDANPPRTFDRAARDALAGWQFAAGSGAGKRFVQTFDFVLDGNTGGVDGCVVSTGSRLCRPGQ